MLFANRKIVYVDMDYTLRDYTTAYSRCRQEAQHVAFPQSLPGFFTGLAPMPGAVETYHWLHTRPEMEVFILTAPSFRNPRLWVETYLGFEIVSRLIISPHKGLNKGDYLIDDNAEGKGQEYFEGELVQFGTERYPDWVEVKRYFS